MEIASQQLEGIAAHFTAQPTDRFTTIRDAGWKYFTEKGWPTRRDEEYKFTALDALIKRKFDITKSGKSIELDTQEILSNFYAVDGHHLVFVNGHFKRNLSTVHSSDIRIESFEEISDEAVNAIVSKTQNDRRATVQINHAFLSNGILIHASKSTQALPVFLYHFNGVEGKTTSFPRVHIVAEENAHIRCYEKSFQLTDIGHFTSSVVSVEVARHANVRLTKLQTYGANEVVLDNLFVQQAADSHFFANTFSFSGGLIRNNLEISINGEHAEANMYGLYLLDGHSHVDNHTVVDHKVANCNSNELYKGIVDEQATGVFNGKIFVRQAAQKTNAFQANNNIVLSDSATVHTKPQLEIWADDVKCSHGCTVGQMDEEALFYLQSRGIRPAAAKAMLLNAFAEETLTHVLLPEINEEITNLIHNRLDV
jgi:Fe-S cluster assembly protein SufD